MKNKESMILTERDADQGRLRAVLRDWGYGESEIHRVLTEHKIRHSLSKHNQQDDSIQRRAKSMSQQDLAGEPSPIVESPRLLTRLPIVCRRILLALCVSQHHRSLPVH